MQTLRRKTVSERRPLLYPALRYREAPQSSRQHFPPPPPSFGLRRSPAGEAKGQYIYGVMESQFRKYMDDAFNTPGVTGMNLLRNLERRLDNVIFHLNFADSRKQARQLVLHGHFRVNDRKTDVPSYQVKAGASLRGARPTRLQISTPCAPMACPSGLCQSGWRWTLAKCLVGWYPFPRTRNCRQRWIPG